MPAIAKCEKCFVNCGRIDFFLIGLSSEPETSEGEGILVVFGITLYRLNRESEARSHRKRVTVGESEWLLHNSSCY